MSALVYQSSDSDHPWLLIRQSEEFGLLSYDLARPPLRFWGDGRGAPSAWRTGVDAARVTPLASPGQLLLTLPAGDNWHAMTRRSLDRLFAWFLVSEDPQHRLDAQPISTLAHQASLVQHVLQEPHLQSVLIADEVGLGKTIEAALIVQKLLAQHKGLRVLYLAPARLVTNVRGELDRMGLHFRIWVAGSERDARLTDQLVVASIHRAVVESHFQAILERDPGAAEGFSLRSTIECDRVRPWQRTSRWISSSASFGA